MKKSFLILLLLFVGNLTFAQTDQILALLNNQFEKEQTMYEPDETDKPRLVQPFTIHNDTLSFAITRPLAEKDNHTEITRRAVHLKDIEGFIKDYNVIFTAKDGTVEETVIVQNHQGNILTKRGSLTYLVSPEFRKDIGQQYMHRNIPVGFDESEYPITSKDWYD